MANVHRYAFCLVVLLMFLAVSVSGQYYHPNEYLKYSAPAPRSADKSHSLQDVEIVARNTPFQYFVADILETAEGDLNNVLDLDLPANVSAKCQRDFNQFMLNITELYALQMVDATGKIPSGLLQGNVNWWGRYDQCRSIKSDDNHDFNGGYCTVTLTSYKPGALISTINLGVCVPDSCSGEDVDELIRNGVLEIPLQLLKYTHSTHCPKDPEYSAGAITGLIIFSLLGLLVVAGTGLEIAKYILKELNDTEHATNVDYQNGVGINSRQDDRQETMAASISEHVQNENTVDVPDNINLVPSKNQSSSSGQSFTEWIEKFLLCFSALTNGRKLLTVQSSGPHSHLAALNGIRVISMFWVILGHTHLFANQFVDNVATVYTDQIIRFSFQVINNGTFSVDTFFVLSGLLVCYFALNELKAKDGRLNWVMFYFHRFWRLTPVYMLVILMYTTLVPHFVSGPISSYQYTDYPPFYTSPSTLCRKYWWTNLLYINNLYPQHLGEECLGWSWYLANDMQFYVISPIILVLLYRFSAIGFAVMGALTTMCFTCNAVISWKYDLSPGMLQPAFTDKPVAGADDFIYVKPWTRINSYLVGMLTGYILYRLKGHKVTLPKVFYAVGWCCAIGTGIGIIYGLYGTLHGHYQTQGQAVFYYTVSRFLWAAAVAWVAFVCATGHGGPVNAFLGWSVWGPLARLTYCAYLLHPIFIYVYLFGSVTPIHYTDYNMVYIFLGNLVMSYAAAFIMSVCAEAPFMALEKLLLPKRGAHKSSPPSQPQPDQNNQPKNHTKHSTC